MLNSDLTRGRCSARDLKLLIVDEAHRALGDYAYCKAVRELVSAGAQTRIVALSATPGSDIQSVKKIIQNLCISHIELGRRTVQTSSPTLTREQLTSL